MSWKNINYVGKLFKCDGKSKLWEELKNGFDLQGQLSFIYKQIIIQFQDLGKMRLWQTQRISKI